MKHKYFYQAALWLGLCAGLCGCLVSDHRLPANETPSADSPYAGFWQSPWPAMLTRESLNVTYVPGKDYFVAVSGRGKYYGKDNQGKPVEVQESTAYQAYPSKVGDRMFFSLYSTKNEAVVYAIVWAELLDGGKRLVVREPSDAAVQRAMDQGALQWRIQEDSRVATSSGEQMAVWLSSLSPKDFQNEQVYERWPKPVDELKEKRI